MAKRILGFTPLFPPHVGGLENHAQQLNQHLAERGHVTTVWAPRVPKTGKFKEITPAGVRILRYPAIEIVSNYPAPNIFHPIFWRQSSIIWREQWDVVISHTRFFLPSLFALIFARIHRLPLLHIEHGSDFVHLHNHFLRISAYLYDLTLGRIVLRNADAVVAISQAAAAFVVRLSGRATDAVIYRGIDAQAIADVKPAAPPPLPIVTYVGRLIDGKGVHVLLDALARLKRSTWQAWIIGDGPARTALQEQARRLDIADSIEFFGSLPWKDGIARMKASTIIVNPSYTEGLPTAVIEAAVTNAYVVATDVGGTAEIIGQELKTCRLVPPGDTDALVQALQILIRRTPAEQSERARRVLAAFTWPASIQSYEKLFERLTRSTSSGSS